MGFHECDRVGADGFFAAFGPDATWADSVPEALARIRKGGLPVLVAGSLYLAGDVLRLSGALPD